MTTSAVRLGDVSEIIMGQAPPGSACNKEGEGTAFVKAGEFSDVEPVIREWTTEPLKLARRGDVFVCVVGATAGKVNLGIDCAIGRSVAAVRPKPKRLDTQYLHYFLRTRTSRLRDASQGLAQGVITREMLAKLDLPLPPLNEQRRIAAILDKADALRRKRRRVLELLEELASALVYKYFDESKTIELNEIISDGPTNGLYKPASAYGDGSPILRINNFYAGRIVDLSSLKRLRVTDLELSRYRLTEGDIVINRVNSLEYLGKSAIVQGLSEPTVYESNMMRFSVNKTIMLPEVCIALLQTPAIRRQVLAKAKNAVNQSSINQGDVCSLVLPLPAMIKQERFVIAARTLMTLEATVTNGQGTADALFSSLQHRAFSGYL